MRLTSRDSSANEKGIERVCTSREETRAFYNRISGIYDLLAVSENTLRQSGLKKLDVNRGERVLEIGCGTGHSMVALAQAVGTRGKAYGIDLSDKMLKITQTRLAEEGVSRRVLLTRGDAVKLPYRSGMLDAIFASFTLELFDTPEIPIVLAECKRVLHPGGRIVVVSLSKEGPEGAITHIYEWTHRHFPHYFDCRPIFVRKALEASGFRIESVDHHSLLVPVEIVLASKQ